MAEPSAERTDVIARYEDMQYGMFIHFTMNTFLDKPFCASLQGPLPPPETYCPSSLDVDQWIAVAKEAEMKYAVLTAKHYLGFALWHSKHGIAPCLYYSLGVDIAHRRDGGMTEDEWYEQARNQITELLTDYGRITTFWFDGLGLQAGVTPARMQQAYDLVKSLQPRCLVTVNQGHGSNGTRLARFPADVFGGERTLPPPNGHDPLIEHEGTTYYIPMEVCDTSAQGTFSKGWFWEPGERMKEVTRELLLLYRNATTRGANLLLNVAIDRDGRVPEATVERLVELAEAV